MRRDRDCSRDERSRRVRFSRASGQTAHSSSLNTKCYPWQLALKIKLLWEAHWSNFRNAKIWKNFFRERIDRVSWPNSLNSSTVILPAFCRGSLFRGRCKIVWPSMMSLDSKVRIRAFFINIIFDRKFRLSGDFSTLLVDWWSCHSFWVSAIKPKIWRLRNRRMRYRRVAGRVTLQRVED